MLHVVFQYSDIETLHKAIELDESLKGEVIEIQDELAVGPIADIFTEEGQANRNEWWQKVMEFSPYVELVAGIDDRKKVNAIKERLSADDAEQLWIWVAPNPHDVCGYYWLISQLRDYEGRIHILFLNNLPFINDKGSIFYPESVFEIPPREFLKAKKLARPITTSEFELDTDEWNKLCRENAMVRRLEGGKKIVSKEASYFDKDILKAITAEDQKLQKIFHTIFSKIKVRTGDAFLAWRMRQLIDEGKIEMTGDWKNGWKEVALKLPAVVPGDEKAELDVTV
ncbi:MAG TPA: DUF1835 domain-containing protein [Parafilimonas sp.]|nr:DUF1835 domain-containing protein [Parafilimonas sp.]